MSEITIRLPKFLSVSHKFIDLRSGLSGSPKADILSGLTVALALVPEAVAFAFLAGVPPLVGLYAAFIICLLTSIFGGRPGMISGATGAMGVVVIIGVALSALAFAWNKSMHLIADVKFNEHESKVYQLHGVLFFGSVTRFRDLFTPQLDPQDVVIDFYFRSIVSASRRSTFASSQLWRCNPVEASTSGGRPSRY